ncbi:MAG: chalcone isomerase family protein [Pseudomonadaceae bacterium]
MTLPSTLLTVFLLLASTTVAATADATLTTRNQHLFRYLFMDIYTATLYARSDSNLSGVLDSQQPIRLSLRYHRPIDREDMIKAARITLERQHPASRLAPLQADIDRLHSHFTDVTDGDSYSLTRTADGELQLHYNNTLSFSSNTPGLADIYLGIWLGQNGLSDNLRNALLR